MRSFEAAYKKTIAYVTRLMEKSENFFGVCLGLPMTTHNATLLVCVGLDRKLLVIDIFDHPVNLGDIEAFQKFFALVYGAVTSLAKRPIFNDHNFIQILPPPNPAFELLFPGVWRVFIANGVVYKLFDQNDKSISPNLEVITCIANDYLPDVELVDLSRDQRFQCLRYKYLEGSHIPKSYHQLLTIMRALKKLHNSDYVHSDIRKQNLIFGVEDDEAWIIDFDLAGKVGSRYPESYNYLNIPERHNPARDRAVAHDVQAIKKVFEANFEFTLNLPRDYTLDNVIEAIERHYHIL